MISIYIFRVCILYFFEQSVNKAFIVIYIYYLDIIFLTLHLYFYVDHIIALIVLYVL